VNSTTLNSRFSIILLCILANPLLGVLLFCQNLKRIGKGKLAFGVFLRISLSTFFASIPVFGMNISQNTFFLIMHIVYALMGLLIIHPLWNKQVDTTEHEETFPFKWFFILLSVSMVFYGYNVWLAYKYSLFTPPPSYLPRFTYIHIYALILLIVFLKFIFDIISRAVAKIRKS